MIAYPIVVDLQTAVLTTYDDDGYPSTGVDGEASTVALQPAEALHPLGIIARPIDPDTDGDGNARENCCIVMRLAEGNTDHVVALSDPRCTPTLPRIAKGSSLLYAPNGTDDPAHILLDGNTGTLNQCIIHVPSTAKVTIEVEGGPSITIDNTAVQLGGVGGAPVVIDTGGAFTAWLASVVTALAAAGHPVSAPPTIAAVRTKAT